MLLNVKICLMIYILMSKEILWLSFSFFRNFLHNEMLVNAKIWQIIFVLMRDKVASNYPMDSFWPRSFSKLIHFSAFVLHSCFGKDKPIKSIDFLNQISSHATLFILEPIQNMMLTKKELCYFFICGVGDHCTEGTEWNNWS